jgi:hypothetical protein
VKSGKKKKPFPFGKLEIGATMNVAPFSIKYLVAEEHLKQILPGKYFLHNFFLTNCPVKEK